MVSLCFSFVYFASSASFLLALCFSFRTEFPALFSPFQCELPSLSSAAQFIATFQNCNNMTFSSSFLLPLHFPFALSEVGVLRPLFFVI